MSSNPLVIFPKEKRELSFFGERLKLARLRRKFSASTVAKRANISRTTLYRVERGSPVVSIGVFFRVLWVLGLDADIQNIASDDVVGRRLQDLNILAKKGTKQ